MAALAAAVRAGNDIVVPQPTCGYVLKRDCVAHVGGADAELVATSPATCRPTTSGCAAAT